MDKYQFSKRLTALRMNRNVSSRKMSQFLGKSDSYINNIENCVNMPTMEQFFAICEYFGITESEFFDTDTTDPARTKDLLEATKGMSVEQLEHLTAIARDMKK